MNKGILSLLFVSVCLMYAPIQGRAQGYTYLPNTTTTEVLSNNQVIFRFSDSSAASVSLVIGTDTGPGLQTLPMSKDSDGLWSVTMGPLTPRIYEYHFVDDGLFVQDPANGTPKPHRSGSDSLLQISGDPLVDDSNIPHGTLHTETYFSNVLGLNRKMVVYTPAGYDYSGATRYPALYLYHDAYDVPWTLVADARVLEMLDYLIYKGQAVPMVVVLLNLHALPPENFVASSPNTYFIVNQQYADKELFNDIVPYLNTQYCLRTGSAGGAIAGFGSGGYEAIESGVQHLGTFSSIGAFSPTPLGNSLGTAVYNTLGQAATTNSSLKSFNLAVGDQDVIAGPAVKDFHNWLNAHGVTHTYNVISGVYNIDTMRRELTQFLATLFR
jgi:enterochelin esterase-like enzyme